MRIAITILVGLGLIAGLCAVLLIRVLAAPGAPTIALVAEPEVELVEAVRELPTRTLVDGTMVRTRKVLKSKAPPKALTDSNRVIGKVLSRRMVEGEVFSESSFVNEGLGVYLAETVPTGKRAVSVQFTDSNAMAGLLYPGSIVDVLLTVQPPGGSRSSGAISTTLLQGVQVLAIGAQAVTDGQAFVDKNPGALNKQGQQVNTRMVTLLVDPKQAEMLQLAVQYGFVTLAMRNPEDTAPVAKDLTHFSEVISSDRPSEGTSLLSAAARWLTTQSEAASAAKSAKDRSAEWEMLIIRGATSQTEKFPMPEPSRPSAAAPVAPASLEHGVAASASFAGRAE